MPKGKPYLGRAPFPKRIIGEVGVKKVSSKTQGRQKGKAKKKY